MIRALENPSGLLSAQAHSFTPPALRQITFEVQKVNGINLGQGTCQLPAPPEILQFAAEALQEGQNRYTDSRGILTLREAFRNKLAHFNKITEGEVMATSGTTAAFEGVCATLLDPGDEVVVFEPYYPYHLQALKRYRANVQYVPLLAPTWEIDFDALRAAVTPRTKFVLVNTPSNPTGKVFSGEELLKIAEILEPFNALLVTDEIYEYMTFDGRKHVSAGSLPELAPRTITMGGYSKTFSITGWRVGYLNAPTELAGAIARTLDAIYVCPPAPLQQGVAKGVALFGDDFYRMLCAKYEAKRNFFAAGLEKAGLKPFLPEGSYYLLASYEGELSSRDFVSRMIAEAGVGAVPSDDFVRDSSNARWIRFCCAVEDEVLEAALEQLQTRL